MEYLAAWRMICLPQNHRPSCPSVLQAGVGQPVKVVQGVQHSSLPQEEPPSSRHQSGQRGSESRRRRIAKPWFDWRGE